MKRLFLKVVCMLRGHDFGPVVYVSPSVLIHCSRCGEELLGRSFDDLEYMTEEDREHVDMMDSYHDHLA